MQSEFFDSKLKNSSELKKNNDKPGISSQQKIVKSVQFSDSADDDNQRQLDVIRQEMREKSNAVRNTTIREIDNNKLPYKNGENTEFNYKISTENKTIYIGKNAVKDKVVLAANPSSYEYRHADESVTIKNSHNNVDISMALPKEKNVITLDTKAVDKAQSEQLLRNVSNDSAANFHSDGAVKNAFAPVVADREKNEAKSIAKDAASTADSRKQTALQHVSDIAQAVAGRKENLQKSAEIKVKSVINNLKKNSGQTLSENDSSDDDFFDFLHKKRDDEENISPINDDISEDEIDVFNNSFFDNKNQ